MNDSFNLREFLYNNPLLEKKKTKKKKKDEETDAPEMDAPEADDLGLGDLGTNDSGTDTGDMNLPDSGEDAASDDISVIEKYLIDAHEASKKLGDEKLVDQIGNTITYFNRTHIAQTATPPASKTISN